MVYKKYIKRNGKVFGPYYYESYRENGRVKTRFVSGPKKEDLVKEKIKDKRNYFIFGFLILVIIGIFVLAFYYSDEISERIYGIGLLAPPYGGDVCGDAICGSTETCTTCMLDCGACPCAIDEDCDDDNECTTDYCVEGVCFNDSIPDCGGGGGGGGGGGSETETPGETQTHEEEVIIKISETYSIDEITQDIFIENFLKEGIQKNVELVRISDDELEVYDADTGDLVVTITRGVNKVDINLH